MEIEVMNENKCNYMIGYALNKNCIMLCIDQYSFLRLDKQENNYKRNIFSLLNKTSIFYSCLLFDDKERNEIKNEINVLFSFSSRIRAVFFDQDYCDQT